jgi:hypothetical protein
MAPESTPKVRAEARGHMKTKTFSDPETYARIRVSVFNE